MEVRELITKLGFNLDEAPLKKAEQGILSLKNGVRAFLAIATTGAIAGFFKSAANHSEELIKASQRTGIAVESLQRLGYAAQLADVDMGSLQQGLSVLARNFIEAKSGAKDAAEAFKSVLGANLNKKEFQNTEQLFLAVTDGVNKITDVQKRNSIEAKIFGRSYQQLVPLLAGGSEEIRKAGDELEALGGILGVDALRAGNQFNDNLKRTTRFFTSLRDVLAAKLFPYLNGAIERFIEFAKKNKDLIRTRIDTFLQAVGRAFSLIGDVVSRASNLFLDFSESVGGSKNALLAITAVITSIAFLINPIVVGIEALGAALFLVYDDFKGFQEGKKAFFDWPEIINAVTSAVQGLTDTWNGLMFIVDKFLSAMKFINKINPFSYIQPTVNELIQPTVKNALSSADTISGTETGQKIKSNLRQSFYAGLNPLAPVFKSLSSLGASSNDSAVFFPSPNANKISVPSSDVNQKNDLKVNQNITINLDTGGSEVDAKDLAEKITAHAKKAINNELKTAYRNLQPLEGRA